MRNIKGNFVVGVVMLLAGMYLFVNGVLLVRDYMRWMSWTGRAEGYIEGLRDANNQQYENIIYKTSGGTYNMYGNPYDEVTNNRVGQTVEVWYDESNHHNSTLPIPQDLWKLDVIIVVCGVVFSCVGIVMVKVSKRPSVVTP